MSNPLDILFSKKEKNITSIYFTSGYPNLEDTETIISELNNNGVDLIEVGIPFSDPLADGPTIQNSSTIALENGISLEKIFQQLEAMKTPSKAPLVLMGYYNQLLQFGMENFLKRANNLNIGGVIVPDMPYKWYLENYSELFEKYNIYPIFLVTPQTSDERIKEIANASKSFLYVVSTAATTGKSKTFSEKQIEYFQKVKRLAPKTPKLIGFGISDSINLKIAFENLNGAIIGSAFIKALGKTNLKNDISNFFKNMKL